MKSAFPISGMVDAADGSGHQIYFESHGPVGAPAVVMVHGNAGYVFDSSKLSMWDLSKQRVIMIHARGVGLSVPAGKIEHNLYPDLAGDIETVRAHLNIDKIDLFGWSAGAAICAIYAQQHADRVRDITFYGAFLGGANELKAYYKRSGQQHPVGWKEFSDHFGPRDEFFAVKCANTFLLYGTPDEQSDAALRYERIFGPFHASGAALDRLVANRRVYANMIEDDFGLYKHPIIIPANATFIRGENDYIGSAVVGETVIENAGHDIHDPHVQKTLKAILAGINPSINPSINPQSSPSPAPQSPQP